MLSSEQFNTPDQKPILTNAEAKKMQKKRAENLQQKYGLEAFSTEDVLKNEGKISDAVHAAVKDTESELTAMEGNVAENLVKAAESGSDGDIQAALNTAQTYHSRSDARVGAVLKQRRDKKIQAVFLAVK